MNKQLNRLNQTRKLRQLLVVCALLLLPLGTWGQTTYYDLWVDGTWVNSSNASNVDGNNRVSFTPADGTNPAKLTLNDALLNKIRTEIDNLVIEINGTCDISPQSTDSAAIQRADPAKLDQTLSGQLTKLNLTFTGTGFLKMKPGSSSYKSILGITPTHPGMRTLGNYNTNGQAFAVANQILGGGEGTSGSPYLITSASEMNDFRIYVNMGLFSSTDEYFELYPSFQIDYDPDNNGRSSVLSFFQPIGTEEHPFKGTLIGNDKMIVSLAHTPQDPSTGYNGLFGVIDGGTVTNVKMANCSFTGGQTVGTLVGYLKSGTIENCVFNTCSVTTGNAESVTAGGVAGMVDKGIIRNCTVNQSSGGSIKGESTATGTYGVSNVGGIAGIAGALQGTGSVSITSCEVNKATILSKLSATQDLYAGGIVGRCRSNVSLQGNRVTNSTTSSCQSVDDHSQIVLSCGAIVGDIGSAALTDNTYEYSVTTSTQQGNNSAIVRSGYETRGTGVADQNGNYDELTDDGTVLNTKTLTIQGLSANDGFQINAYYEPKSDTNTRTYAIAPGQDVTVTITPNDANYTVVSVTLSGGPLSNVAQTGGYMYSFNMPAADATLDVAIGIDYHLSIGSVAVYSGNAGDVLNNKKVSYDETTHTLTLDGASIDLSQEEFHGVNYSGADDLIIKLIGNNSIKTRSGYTPILYNGTYQTDPKLTFEIGGPSSLALDGRNGTVFKNFASVSGVNGISGATGNLLMLTNANNDELRYDYNTSGLYDGNTTVNSVTLSSGLGLSVGGVLVYEGNKTNVLGNNNQGTPTVVFTPAGGNNNDNILTLTDAILTAPIIVGLSNLTFDVQGTNTITTSESCLQKMDGTDPSITIKSTSQEVGSLTMKSTQDYVSEITNITVSKELAQIYPNSGAVCGYSSNIYYLVNGVYEAMFMPSCGVMLGDLYVHAGNAADVFGDGTATTAPTASFDKATSTLTLNNFNINGYGGISTSLSNLTVELIGNNKITEQSSSPTLTSLYGEPVTMTIQSTGATKGGLTLRQPYTPEGTFTDSHVALNIVAPLSVVSGSLTGNNDNDNTIFIAEPCGLTVNGVIVTYMNKDNILNDKTASVRFNPTTSTLSLYSANVTTTGDFVTSSLTNNLTVDLHGSNTLSLGGSGKAFVSTISSHAVPLKFTTDASNPGQLSWTAGHDLYSVFDTPTYENSLALQTPDNLISQDPITNYGLTIGITVVNSVNCTDVLRDGKVRYIDDTKTLVLEDATITNEVIQSSLSGGLTIHLLGENTITNTGSDNLLVSTVANAPLKIVTTPNTPGKLTLTKNTGAWISGFADPTYPTNYTKVEATNNLIFSLASTIKPIVVDKEDGTQPEAKEGMENPVETTGDGNTNKVINNVLYTVPKSDDSFINGTYGNPDAVCLGVAPTEEEVSEAQTKIPGTDAFASKFTGLTFELPAGTGKVKVEAEIENGVKMAVKIGNNAAELFPKDASTYNVLTTYEVPYDVKVPTYVYVYLSETPAGARSEVRGRAKVMTGHIKVTTVGAVSNSMVMDDNYSEEDNVIKDDVKLFSLPDGAIQDGDKGVVLSKINVDGDMKQITEIAPIVLVNLPNKDKIRYIDLTGTAIKDFTVNRSNATLSGLGSNTLIYMPNGNDDGGESNVIMNGTCASLSLASDNGFFVPTGFTATKAQLNRNFKAAQTSTIFLPFALSKTDADNLGTFHEFDKISGDNALFKDAITTGTEANTPYIFVPKADVDNIAVDNVNIEGFGASSVTKESMVGTYEKISWDAEQTNVYGFAAVDEGTISAGQFVRVDAGAWIPPFRAYLMVTEISPSRLNVVIAEGETTDLKEVKEVNEVREVNDNRFYSISGQRVSQPSKGLYIINGKKVLVK